MKHLINALWFGGFLSFATYDFTKHSGFAWVDLAIAAFMLLILVVDASE